LADTVSFRERGIVMTLKNRIYHLTSIISMIIVIDLISFGIAESANNTQVVIDENLRPGMTLKDAIQLLGPPETMTVSDMGTIIIPYNTLGLSIEAKRNGIVIEKIHVLSSFKGKFASGIKIGADFQKILAVYGQPDIMTKEIIEYSGPGRRFQLIDGKFSGVDLYAEKNTSNRQVSYIKAGKHKKVDEEVKEEVREELRKELRDEVLEELREDAVKVNSEEFDVFDLYGFKVKQTTKGVMITEIRPDSVAEHGDLKVGELIRKAFYDRTEKLNIYSISGLEKILIRAIKKYKKTINILQDKNYYYKVEVPKRW
jgi:hypothetical protein